MQTHTQHTAQPATPSRHRRNLILAALATYAAQRPGLEYGNYGDLSAYRSEMRSITRYLHHARGLLAYVGWHDSIGEAELLTAARSAYSGRLSLAFDAAGAVRIEYCTGQYWPTEYRRAVCAVLASAIWDYWRACCMPALIGYRVESWTGANGRTRGKTFADRAAAEADRAAAEQALESAGGQSYGCVSEVYPGGLSAGDYLRRMARREFGAAIARRWFN